MAPRAGRQAPPYDAAPWAVQSRTFGNLLCIFAGIFIVHLSMSAANADTIGIPPRPIQNFYGEVGLLDMPSARFQPDGELSFTMSAMPVGERYSLGFQALPWLETEFRYARIDRMTIHRDDYDRSLGFKIRLSKEDEFWPSLAIGAQDILGTGAFGAEYLVASKQVGDFDFTTGLGWRRFSGFAGFENPLGLISKSFLSVPPRGAHGGTPLISQFFHGPKTGIFGGITWNTPIEGLALIAELSGDSYQQQQMTGAIHIRMPVNFGFSYDPFRDLQVSGGYMYGSQWGVRFSLFLDGAETPPSQRLGVQPPPIHERTPEERKQAVLSLLQDTTAFYDNSPFSKKDPSPLPQSARSQSQGELSDALFEDASSHKVSIRNIETFGSELIVDVHGRRGPASCADFSETVEAARLAGFDSIVLSLNGGARAKICSAKSAVIRTQVDDPIEDSNLPAIAEAMVGAGADTADETPKTKQPDVIESTIAKALDDQKIGVVAIHVGAKKIEVAFANVTYQNQTEAIGRVLRVLMENAPDDVEYFRLVSVENGVPTTGITFSRSDLERTLDLYGSASELLASVKISSVAADDPLLTAYRRITYPDFGYSISPGYRHSLFDPDNPYQFQFYATFTGAVSLTPNIGLTGSFEVNIYNTFNAARQSNSLLPHVRSDFAQYYKHGINGFSDIMASYVGKLTPDIYFMGKAGYLESMFAGAGGEIFWQPPHSRLSFGGALYAVQQRGFDRLFDLRHYKVITGHLSAYYDSPVYDLNFELDVGRYLAGDYGATFQVTRRFDNGIEVGAYVTLTNVPFAQFGEGSFDKGIIVHIPVGDVVPVNTQNEMRLDFSPLTRDGGQRLDGEETLHDVLQRSSESELLPTWDEILRP